MTLKDLAIFRPFRHRNFNLLLTGEFFYRTGVWMSSMLFGILATHLRGNSTLYVGLVGFGFNLPMLLLFPFTGWLADRVRRIYILRWLQCWYIVPAVAMVIMLFSGTLHYWTMFSMVILFGIGFSFGNPALISSIHDVIAQARDLGSAVSIFISTNRVFQFVGYGLGGILFSAIGGTYCFLITIVLYLITLGILCAIKIKNYQPAITVKKHPLHEIKEGLLFAISFFPIAATIVLATFNGFFAWPYIFQMPLINKYYLGGTPATLGLLLSIGGVGGAVGGILVAFRAHIRHITHLIVFSSLLIVLCLISLSFCKRVGLAMPIVFFLDLALSMSLVVINIFVQHLCPNDKRGRVMAIVSLTNFGTIPISSLLYYGELGEWLGPMRLFIIGSVIYAIATIWYITQLPRIRRAAAPVLVEKELLASLTEADQI